MPFPLIPLLALGAGYVTLSSVKRTDQESDSVTVSPTTDAYRALVAVRLADPRFLGINLDFCMRWMQEESAGNLCARGKADQWGTGDAHSAKFPREMGLGQLYNIDDFRQFGIDPASFRAYCKPGDSQEMSREATADEIDQQVVGFLLLVDKCRKAARAVSTGWDESSADFRCMTKLYHALPVLVTPGFVKVVAILGRKPSGWMEFADVLPSTTQYPKSTVNHLCRVAEREAGFVGGTNV